jgi:hypothetical protein
MQRLPVIIRAPNMTNMGPCELSLLSDDDEDEDEISYGLFSSSTVGQLFQDGLVRG